METVEKILTALIDFIVELLVVLHAKGSCITKSVNTNVKVSCGSQYHQPC